MPRSKAQTIADIIKYALDAETFFDGDDIDACNECSARLGEIDEELKQHPELAASVVDDLVRLLDDPRESVRLRAAEILLPYRTKLAQSVIVDLDENAESFFVSHCAGEWLWDDEVYDWGEHAFGGDAELIAMKKAGKI